MGNAVHRVRVVLPSAPAAGASVNQLEERMRTASRAKAQAEAVRAEAAAELARRRGNGVAEITLRKQSGQSTRGARQELQTGQGLEVGGRGDPDIALPQHPTDRPASRTWSDSGL